MTQEDKQLLLKDLSARLSYAVKIIDEPAHCIGELFLISTTDMVEYETETDTGMQTIYNIKPYLRPMSSMTKKEQRYIWDKYGPSFLVADFEDAGDVSELFNYCQMNISRAPSFVDWLNEHHFDFRGLIEKGLALEAPEGMYKM